MKLPADVLDDLLTLYAAGEASPGTRALIEEEIKQNPTLASRLNAPMPSTPPLAVKPDACLKSLNRIKRFHLIRMFLLGFGLVTLIVPLHPFFWDDSDRAKKTFVAVSEGTSAMAWGMFTYYSEKIRRAGLR
jgi:hypothetical protein